MQTSRLFVAAIRATRPARSVAGRTSATCTPLVKHASTFIRALYALCWLWALALPSAALAQSVRAVPRVGWLAPVTLDEPARLFLEAMLRLGYVEGRTMTVERRSAEGDLGSLPRLAGELVSAKVDVIVAVSPPAILAAKQASATIPVVMAFWGGDGLVESGLVRSLARPGGSVTGINMLAEELEAKRLEILLQIVPRARRIGVLDPYRGFTSDSSLRTVRSTDVQLQYIPVGDGGDPYQRAFASLSAAHIDALLVPSWPRFLRDARQIIDLAASHRVPAIYEWPSMAEDGGLIAYGPKLDALEQRVAHYVDRILKGARPGDLPIEQPTTFELVVNMKTARAIGVVMPQMTLVRADRVID